MILQRKKNNKKKQYKENKINISKKTIYYYDLREKFDEKQKRQNDIAQEVGCSNWLTSLELREFNYTLNKQQFWDCIRLRYNWIIPSLPSVCACVCTVKKADSLIHVMMKYGT